jgi:acylphosphatase
LRGWVRNRGDGTVEALLIGEDAAVGAMAEACRRGPRAAAVGGIETAAAEDDGSTGFSAVATL